MYSNTPAIDNSSKCARSLSGVKEKSDMGFHTDVKYDKKGVYCDKVNCQLDNTSTIVVTMGKDKVLKWRQKVMNDKGYFEHNTEFNLSYVKLCRTSVSES